MNDPRAPSRPSKATGHHQIRRSATDFVIPGVLKGPHSRHSVHLPRRERHSQDNREPQSATPILLRHSVDMQRPDILSQSRRESGLLVVATNTTTSKDDEISRINSGRLQSQTGNKVDLAREQEQATRRVDNLKESLGQLHTFSAAATTRLDESYYAVLEKMSALQRTVMALRDLAETSHDIYGTFDKGSKELQADITIQLNSFGRFDEHQSKIESLQDRIRGGREQIKSLSQRVDMVRDQVESWERADKEWQQKTRRRLRYAWIIVSVVALVVLGLLLASQQQEESSNSSADKPTNLGPFGGYLSKRRGLGRRPLSSFVEGEPGGPLPWMNTVKVEERLRGFDEL